MCRTMICLCPQNIPRGFTDLATGKSVKLIFGLMKDILYVRQCSGLTEESDSLKLGPEGLQSIWKQTQM